MKDRKDVEVGDWISFYRDGAIVYAKVEYLEEPDGYPWKWSYVTTLGYVEDDFVLEIRKVGKP